MSKRTEFIAGLRELADFLEKHRAAPLPVGYLNAFPDDDIDLASIARAIGSAEKDFNGDWLFLNKQFGPIQYAVSIKRERFCEKRVIGTRIVPASPEHEEEIFAWDCVESILAGNGNHQ